ncbi:methyl-accepting chemotaxis protein, partial [Azospirillum brasilense]|nr:methyl-accepting chemotaxis protein [Azospirillum brasilense]
MALVKKKRIDTASASRGADLGEEIPLADEAALSSQPDNALSTRRAAEVRRRARAGNRRRQAAEGIGAAPNGAAPGVTHAAAGPAGRRR